MATGALNAADPAESDEFLIVDRLDQSLGKLELEAKIFNLREEILLLKSWKITCEKFQEKFFELFIAFTVLVTPLAIAFVFNYLFSSGTECNMTRDMVYNCSNCPPEWENFPPCPNKDDEACLRPREAVCCLLVPSSTTTTQHIRDAVVPVLIAISFIVGLPYYYHMLDELSHTNGVGIEGIYIVDEDSAVEEDDSGDEGDEEDSDEEGPEGDAKEGKVKRKKKVVKKVLAKEESVKINGEPSLVSVD